MTFAQPMRSVIIRVNSCARAFNCFPCRASRPSLPARPSPASRLSLVFFQITSRALAVESRMWSLKDLRRGARRGRAIAGASGSPMHPPGLSAALAPRPSCCAPPAAGLPGGGGSAGPAPSGPRHRRPHCGPGSAGCRRPPGQPPARGLPHLERLTNEPATARAAFLAPWVILAARVIQ